MYLLGKDHILAGSSHKFLSAKLSDMIGRDFMAFPASLPNDGLIDVTVALVVGSQTLTSVILMNILH